MSLVLQPENEPHGVAVSYSEYQRVCQELARWRRTAHESQQKLSAVTAAIQNASLSWKERGTLVAVVLALEAQRPREDPKRQFHVNLGDLSKRAGLIPPTPEGDEEALSKAWKSGRKLAGQVVKDLAEHGVIEGRFVDFDHDRSGEATTSSVVVQIERPHVDVVRAVSQMGGTRKLLKPRGIHTKIEPRCPECHSMDTDLRCHSCGAITATRDILDAMDAADATGFQRLETLYRDTQRGEEETASGFQSLETGETDRPDALDELKAKPQWVFWKWVERDGRRTKPPYDPTTGGEAKCNDPSTWGTIVEAWAAKQRYGGAGVGFMFAHDYVGVDIDDCRDPETGAIKAWAQRIIDELASYTEVSPSGTGVHIFLRGTLPAGGRRKAPVDKGSVEMYDGGRYFTVTGRHVTGTPSTIEDRREPLACLYSRLFPPAPASPARLQPAALPDDEELIRRASSAKNGDAFERLWRGDLTDVGGDESRGDWRLVLKLKYWTHGDPTHMDRLFRQSGLMRDKWDRADGTHGTYGQRTIRKALERGN